MLRNGHDRKSFSHSPIVSRRVKKGEREKERSSGGRKAREECRESRNQAEYDDMPLLYG